MRENKERLLRNMCASINYLEFALDMTESLYDCTDVSFRLREKK